MIKRHLWVLAHRWVGLVLAGFLLLVGLTGSVLPFYEDLDKALAPQLKTVDVSDAAVAIDPLTLREQLLGRHPGLRADAVLLSSAPGHALRFRVQPGPDAKQASLEVDEIYVDPTSGRELGGRLWGDISQGLVNLMPFIYRLHYSLAAGSFGQDVLGIVALLWTLDCFVGAYLTFPLAVPRREGPLVRAGQSWWSRWMRAWAVRHGASGYRLNFDLHRAGGLWLWAMLFVFAWSAVSFNLSQVYRPVMGTLLGPVDLPLAARSPQLALDERTLDWRRARDRARALMRDVASTEQVVVKREELLALDRDAKAWRYVVTSDRDLREQGGSTTILFDVQTGELLSLQWPTGQHAGRTVTTWLTDLHTARVGGLPGRLFISVMGLVLVMLCITGVAIWLRKRAGRRSRVGEVGRSVAGIGARKTA